MEQSGFNLNAFLISFVIWLDIDISILTRVTRKGFKAESDIIREKAEAEGSIVIAKKVKEKRHHLGKDDNGYDYGYKYKAIYEYTVDDRKYRKKLVYYNDKSPNEIKIFYDSKNPKKAYTTSERKLFLIDRIITLFLPLSPVCFFVTMNVIKNIIKIISGGM